MIRPARYRRRGSNGQTERAAPKWWRRRDSMGRPYDDLAADGPRARELPGREGTRGGKGSAGAVFPAGRGPGAQALRARCGNLVIGFHCHQKGACAGKLWC